MESNYLKVVSQKIVFIILIPLLGAAASFAQSHSVSGTVTDINTDDTMPGVNIQVKGTTTGTATDTQGQYELSVESLQDTLVFSFIGYQTRQVPMNGRTEINIAMQPQAISGQEMVVVGYGEQQEQNLTGSVSHVEGEELAKSPTQSLSNTFAGKLPGVTAMNRSGEPGADVSSLSIRGEGTLGNNDPLIVIDGVAGRGGLNHIDPDNIKSISVLKDASAAIYGARAANGVILIETKRGTVSEPTVSYNFDQGFAQPANLPNMADAATYAKFYNNILVKEQGKPPRFSKEDIRKFRNGTDQKNHPNTDWVSTTLKNYSTQSRHNLSVQGGSERIRYYIAGNYKNENSIFKNGITHYNTEGIRTNIDVDATDFIKVSLDFSAQYGDRKRPSVSTDRIMSDMWRGYPFNHAIYENGLPAAGIEGGRNPIVMVTDKTGYRKNKTDEYQTKVGIDVQIPGVEGLALDGFFAYDKYYRKFKRWRKPWTVYNYDSETDTYNKKVGGSVPQPTLRQQSSTDIDMSTNVKLTYERQFGDHSTKTFIAGGYKKYSTGFFYAERIHFLSGVMDQLFAGSKVNQSTAGSANENKRAYLIGRLSYNYKEKYLIDFNFRYDGSSNFPAARRWGFFPGVSAAWNISNEKFLKKWDWLTNLKLRASAGIVGNDKIAAHQYLATYNYTTGAFFGPSVEPNQGLTPGVLPNPMITWEKKKSANLGLDVNLWRGGLNFNIDVFKERRSNILTSRGAAVPAYTALNLPDENIGVVDNKGYEFQISHRQVMQDFNFSIGGNVSYAKNKIVNISEAADIPDYQQREGSPMGTRLLYKAIGIFRSQKEIDNYPSLAGAKVGDLKFKDVNNDGIISGNDRVRSDYTSKPQVTFGLNAEIGYKNFTFSMLWRGVTKARRYFKLEAGTVGNIVQDIAENSYVPNAKYPNIGGQAYGYRSDFWNMDASFIRLKNARLDYSIPEKMFSKIGLNIDDMNLYVDGVDLLTFSKFDWFDPEGEATERQSFYPPNRIFDIGIKVKF